MIPTIHIFVLKYQPGCVKAPMPAHQVLPLTAYIFEASHNTAATQANKIQSMDQSEPLNL